MSLRSVAVLAVVLAAALVFASPASAANFTCDASALTAQLGAGPTIEPTVANKGAAVCQSQKGGPALALPSPLTSSALFAETGLLGTATNLVEQTATATGGVADLRLLPLPELGLQPHIDALISQIPLVNVTVPGGFPLLPATVSLDVRPALAGVLAPQAEVLGLRLATAFAKAGCTDGRLALDGSSQVAGLRVLGKDLPTNEATTQLINVLGTGSVNLGQLDITKIVPQGIAPELVSTLQTAIDPVLDTITIPIPELLASVRVTPSTQTRTATSLVQTALGVNISIAGQRIADLALGRAAVGGNGVECASADVTGSAQAALECTTRRLVLTDVFERGGRVRLTGAADRKLIGRTVDIHLVRAQGGGPRVARAKVARDGSFKATAPLPPAAVRGSNNTRYQARLGKERSFRLKLRRRMIVRSVRVSSGKVRISGVVTRPLAAPARTIEVRRRVSCKRWVLVKRIRPRSDGSWSTTVDAPPSQQAAAYRFATKVRKFRRNPKTYPTFTLPRYVDLT